MPKTFQLQCFLPYFLNQAAEVTSLSFQSVYHKKFGITRTEWRVLAHLGEFGEMTAKDICVRASLHKTKVSRAVFALEKSRWLTREVDDADRRHEKLHLTKIGKTAYENLTIEALSLNERLQEGIDPEDRAIFEKVLEQLSNNAEQLGRAKT